MEEDDALLSQQTTSNSGKSAAVAPSVVIWGVASVVFSIFAIVVNTSPQILGAGFWLKTFCVIVASVLGLAGALIGDALRKFAQPNAVFTRGGMGSLIWIKVFWSIGPQVIGLFIGVFVGIGWVLS